MYRHDAVVAFAQQLGIHAQEESDFMWIAEVGLQSPLPPRWTSETDMSTGFIYYIDHDRGASSWENPLVPYLRRVVEIGRGYLAAPTEDFFEEQKGNVWNQHKAQLVEWHGPFADEQGRQFYMNSTQGLSSWQDPRVEAQYLFDLECGLLDSLEKVLPGPEPDTPGWGGNDPWRTENGAEVLTLDAGSFTPRDPNATPRQAASDEPRGRTAARPKTSARVKVLAQKLTQAEHKSTLERMTAAANWIHAAQLDDHEAQRILFNKRAAARRKRRVAIAAAVGVSTQAASKAQRMAMAQRSSFAGQDTPADASAVADLLAEPAAPLALDMGEPSPPPMAPALDPGDAALQASHAPRQAGQMPLGHEGSGLLSVAERPSGNDPNSLGAFHFQTAAYAEEPFVPG